jgi:hypothetical protein
MDHTHPRHWLLLIYRVPQEPAGRRTAVWRHVKQLGAVNLQQAAAILPDVPALRVALTALAERVEEMGGEASFLETVSPSAAWEARVIARFNQARDEEYAEIIENAERFQDEVRRESRKGKFTFAELEELESDWDKLQRWRERVRARDFFAAPAVFAADDALRQTRADLDAFTATVYAEAARDAHDDLDNDAAAVLDPLTHRTTESRG